MLAANFLLKRFYWDRGEGAQPFLAAAFLTSGRTLLSSSLSLSGTNVRPHLFLDGLEAGLFLGVLGMPLHGMLPSEARRTPSASCLVGAVLVLGHLVALAEEPLARGQPRAIVTALQWLCGRWAGPYY